MQSLEYLKQHISAHPAAERDEERLEELRKLNRETKEATGEYLTDVSALCCRLAA